MSMLYRLDADSAAIADRFGARAGADPWQRGHVAPGGFAPVVTAGREFVAGPRMERGPRRMIPRLWGVPPPPNVPYDGRNSVLSVANVAKSPCASSRQLASVQTGPTASL